MADKQDNVHAGHRARIRERFRREGLDAFSEHEVLELLLTYAIPQRDVNPLAHVLLRRFGSLAGVLDADARELTRVEGVGENAAALLTLMPRLAGRYRLSRLGEKPRLSTLAEAREYCEGLFAAASDEQVYMLCLDQAGRLLYPALLHTGTLDSVALYPRDCVETALRHHAYAVILAHNHPGGLAFPSQADYDATRMVIGALSTVGVRLLDHLILAGDGAYSMTRESQSCEGAPESVSYLVRSGAVQGRTGELREGGEDGMPGLRAEDIGGAP